MKLGKKPDYGVMFDVNMNAAPADDFIATLGYMPDRFRGETHLLREAFRYWWENYLTEQDRRNIRAYATKNPSPRKQWEMAVTERNNKMKCE